MITYADDTETKPNIHKLGRDGIHGFLVFMLVLALLRYFQ